MAFSPSFRVYAAAVVLGLVQVCFGQEPKPIAYERLPGDFEFCQGIVKGDSSWVALSQDSLLVGFGTTNAPMQIRPPNGGELRVVAVHDRGLVVGGLGFCYLYTEGRWVSLEFNDHFLSAASYKGGVLLGGMNGVYYVDPSGVCTKAGSFRPTSIPRIFVINGQAYVAPDGEIYRWTGKEVVPADQEFPWAKELGLRSVQTLPDGSLLVCSNRTVQIIRGNDPPKVLVEIPVTRISTERHVFAAQFADIVVVVTRDAGVKYYSARDGSLLWSIPRTAFAGEIYHTSLVDEGVLIGAAHGIYLLPDPSRFRYQDLPPGDVRFSARLGSRFVLGLTTGVYDPDTGEQLYPADVNSLAEIAPGHVVEGRVGLVVFDGSPVQIDPGVVQQIAILDGTTVAVIQPQGLSIVTRDGRTTRVSALGTPNSVVRTKSGHLLAGSAEGGYVISRTGTVQAKFGTGLTRAVRFRDGALGFDSEGNVFSDEGQNIGHLPLTTVWDIADCNGRPYAFGRDEKGERWIGAVDFNTFEWTPLDLPLHPSPTAIANNNGTLIVLGPGTAMRVMNPLSLSRPQTAGITLKGPFRASGPSEPGFTLPSSADTVEVKLPPPRLYPWRNPSYNVQLNGAGFETAPPGTSVRVPRLPSGTSRLTVRAEWAGLSSSTDFEIYRDRPWWLRAPAILLYIGAALFAGYGAVRWRTARLEHRARLLQAMVDERTAELRKAQKAREDFFSTLSHEIRNPLNGVVGICEILEEATPNAIAPRERVFIRTLRACADQLRSILDDVLDFARIDRGAIQIHEEPFELVSSIEGAVRAIDAQMTRCTVRLPDGPIWLRGDVGKVRQIVTNLTSNALKYGVPPEAKIQVAVAEQAPGTKTVRISVINTGPTIPAEELDAIFSGFVRGSDAVKRQISGTGIGLAVSRRIAEAMGGSLVATSQDGLTEFRMEIQFAVTNAPAEVESISPFETSSRALAIEDEQYNRLVLGHILSRMGYEVDWAADGATALERVRSGSYDLILTDFMLPDTNGVDLAKRMLEVMKDPKPPIVAVTAYSTPEKIQQAREAGIVGFVTKPISKKKLESAILGVAPRFRIRQTMDVEPAHNCDFSSLLRLPNGRQILAQYADELPDAWSRLADALSQKEWQESAANLARNVHAFRSRILAIHAMDVAEQISLLEEAVRNQERDTVDRLVAVLSPAMMDITEAARQRATATA
ncbi:hypothetical protein DB347_09460 [Opitutaceae bacterium EW11]|nr:hypothetical protein DB347_09460 [Opitutaceae bacterium EW11]